MVPAGCQQVNGGKFLEFENFCGTGPVVRSTHAHHHDMGWRSKGHWNAGFSSSGLDTFERRTCFLSITPWWFATGSQGCEPAIAQILFKIMTHNDTSRRVKFRQGRGPPEPRKKKRPAVGLASLESDGGTRLAVVIMLRLSPCQRVCAPQEASGPSNPSPGSVGLWRDCQPPGGRFRSSRRSKDFPSHAGQEHPSL